MSIRRVFAFLILFIQFLALDAEAGFRRGASLADLLAFPATEGALPDQHYATPAFPDFEAALARTDFARIRALGFDHIRVPADIGPAMGSPTEYAKLATALRTILKRAEENDLGLIVTLLAPALNGEIPEARLDSPDGPRFTRYTAMALALAKNLDAVKPRELLFEPMNEPQQACRSDDKPDWSAFQSVLIAKIRSEAPTLPLSVTGGCWSKIEGAVLLAPDTFSDPNLYLSIHFYEPFVFTHQGSTWTLPFLAGVANVPYPPEAGDLKQTFRSIMALNKTAEFPSGAARDEMLRQAQEAVRYYFSSTPRRSNAEAFNKLEEWRKTTALSADHVILTEFGAMRSIEQGREIQAASRARWLADVRIEAEKRGYGWTVWTFQGGPFGILEQDGGLTPAMAAALSLKEKDAPHRQP